MTKKRFSVLLVFLVAMAMFASTAFAAPALESKSVTLVSVENQHGGIVLLFHTSGLSQSDLKNNSFYSGSSYHNMYCNFVDDTTDVRCVVSKKLDDDGGSFHVTLGGVGAYGDFPKNTLVCAGGEALWYSYDAYQNGVLDYSGTVPAWIWKQAIAEGYFDQAATYGLTYTQTGQFCGPAYWGPI